MFHVVNTHAPEKTKTVKLVPQAPWFDAEYATLRRQRRMGDRKYRKTGRQKDKDEFTSLRKQTTALSLIKKRSHISNKLKHD